MFALHHSQQKKVNHSAQHILLVIERHAFYVLEIKNTLSLSEGGATYNHLHEVFLQPLLQKSDGSNDFSLPLVEELPLQDLAKFLATSKHPLQGILDAPARALSSNTIFGTDSENPDAGHKLDTPPFKP